MKIKVASISPRVHLAEPLANADEMLALARRAADDGARVIAFPELALTGYTCGDLFLQNTLLENSGRALQRIVRESASIDAALIFGAPLLRNDEVYNCARVVYKGRILHTFYKTGIDDISGLLQSRCFSTISDSIEEENTEFELRLDGMKQAVRLAVLIGSPESFADDLADDFEGDLVVNISEGMEYVGRVAERLDIARDLSMGCAYVLSTCGFGESTTDYCYSGVKIIAQGGAIVAKGCARHGEIISAEVDTDGPESPEAQLHFCGGADGRDPRYPYLPNLADGTFARAFDLQARGLLGRMEAIGCKKAVLGISGGLDSTLALLVTLQTFRLAGYDPADITAVTMPCFGTSDTTRGFALSLMEQLGVTFREINIRAAVTQHLADIGHDINDHNVAFENAQARERTQVLMDLANDLGALVVGTGDMSEIALGWCTYGGDHLSMYGVNAGVPKTLVRLIVDWYARTQAGGALAALLRQILDIPVSPELVPGEDGAIGQKTEDILGPYEVHDFILCNMLCAFHDPASIYGMALEAFDGIYDKETIKHCIQVFYRRFFSSQFKRSCSPDGPMILGFSLSPRSGLAMPSDVAGRIWREEADALK